MRIAFGALNCLSRRITTKIITGSAKGLRSKTVAGLAISPTNARSIKIVADSVKGLQLKTASSLKTRQTTRLSPTPRKVYA